MQIVHDKERRRCDSECPPDFRLPGLGVLGAARAMASAVWSGAISVFSACRSLRYLIRSVAISVAGGSGQPNGMAKRNLIGRGPQMDEVVAAIVALASGAGGFTTATNLILDGGELAL